MHTVPQGMGRPIPSQRRLTTAMAHHILLVLPPMARLRQVPTGQLAHPLLYIHHLITAVALPLPSHILHRPAIHPSPPCRMGISLLRKDPPSHMALPLACRGAPLTAFRRRTCQPTTEGTLYLHPNTRLTIQVAFLIRLPHSRASHIHHTPIRAGITTARIVTREAGGRIAGADVIQDVGGTRTVMIAISARTIARVTTVIVGIAMGVVTDQVVVEATTVIAMSAITSRPYLAKIRFAPRPKERQTRGSRRPSHSESPSSQHQASLLRGARPYPQSHSTSLF